MNNDRILSGSTRYTFHPTAGELARVFWAMGADEQAEFFDRLAAIADALPMQLQYVSDSPHLTPEARAAMVMIGEYGTQP